MTVRTSRTFVTFRRPFLLAGIDDLQPAGTYGLETDEELIEGLSFPAWRRTSTTIFLAVQGGSTQLVGIDPAALEAAQASDALILPEPAMEATSGDEALPQGLTPDAFSQPLPVPAARMRPPRP